MSEAEDTFVQRYLAGDVTPEAVDDYVDRWHEGSSPLTLARFLGFSDAEYERWMLHPTALSSILAARDPAA